MARFIDRSARITSFSRGLAKLASDELLHRLVYAESLHRVQYGVLVSDIAQLKEQSIYCCVGSIFGLRALMVASRPHSYCCRALSGALAMLSRDAIALEGLGIDRR